MNMLADLVAEMRQTSLAFSSLKSVTNVRTLIDIVNTLPLTVGIFSEVAKYFPGRAERSFSTLRRLKTSTIMLCFYIAINKRQVL